MFEQVSREEVLSWIKEYITVHKATKDRLEKASEMVIEKIFNVLATVMNVSVEELKALPNKKRMFDDTTVIIIFLEHNFSNQVE